jgi:hypothetical protein
MPMPGKHHRRQRLRVLVPAGLVPPLLRLVQLKTVCTAQYSIAAAMSAKAAQVILLKGALVTAYSPNLLPYLLISLAMSSILTLAMPLPTPSVSAAQKATKKFVSVRKKLRFQPMCRAPTPEDFSRSRSRILLPPGPGRKRPRKERIMERPEKPAPRRYGRASSTRTAGMALSPSCRSCVMPSVAKLKCTGPTDSSWSSKLVMLKSSKACSFSHSDLYGALNVIEQLTHPWAVAPCNLSH